MAHFERTYTVHPNTDDKSPVTIFLQSVNTPYVARAILKPWWLNYVQNSAKYNDTVSQVKNVMCFDLTNQGINLLTLDDPKQSRKIPAPPYASRGFLAWIYALEFESQEAAIEFILRWS